MQLYFSLSELLTQRSTAISLGINVEAIEAEIALVAEAESMAESRRRHPSNRNRVFDYDQDAS